MGGPGSGRARQRWAVSECRSVSVGELLRCARRTSPPGGEVVWLASGGELQGSLSYELRSEDWPQLGSVPVIALHYQAVPKGRTTRQWIALKRGSRETLGLCPNCQAAVRRLYALPGGEHFACRACQGLIYRRPSPRQRQEQELDEIRAAMGPLLEATLVVDGLLEVLPAKVRPKRRSLAEGDRPRDRCLQEQRGALPGGRT